jgi:putative NADH-flavin reductase
MKLLAIGASGKTGHEVVRQALAAGHEVSAFVRDPARLAIRNTRLSIVTGDARDTDDLRRALQAQDAVSSTLGGPPRQALIGRLRGRPDGGTMERSTTALVAAASEAGVRRVVLWSRSQARQETARANGGQVSRGPQWLSTRRQRDGRTRDNS